MPAKISRITYNLFTIASLIVYTVVIVVSFSNYSVAGASATFSGFETYSWFVPYHTINLTCLGNSVELSTVQLNLKLMLAL